LEEESNICPLEQMDSGIIVESEIHIYAFHWLS